jgi:hypothetical protein
LRACARKTHGYRKRALKRAAAAAAQENAGSTAAPALAPQAFSAALRCSLKRCAAASGWQLALRRAATGCSRHRVKNIFPAGGKT